MTALTEQGWAIVDCVSDEAQVSLALGLGTPRVSPAAGQLTQLLSVCDQTEARMNSLSSRYGRGGFPLHSDLAHRRIPPRFVLLRSAGRSNKRPTLLLDSQRLRLCQKDIEALELDVWWVGGGRVRFLTNVRNTTMLPGRCIFRLDREIMRPLRKDSRSQEVVQELVNRQSLIEQVIVGEKECLVIDNWRVLHGRGVEPVGESGRALIRVFVD